MLPIIFKLAIYTNAHANTHIYMIQNIHNIHTHTIHNKHTQGFRIRRIKKSHLKIVKIPKKFNYYVKSYLKQDNV